MHAPQLRRSLVYRCLQAAHVAAVLWCGAMLLVAGFIRTPFKLTQGSLVAREDQRDEFIADFERHLREPVTLGTIDAIWDDYIRHNPKAAPYARYRPTTPEMLAEADYQAQTQGPDWLGWWVKELERREKGFE